MTPNQGGEKSGTLTSRNLEIIARPRVDCAKSDSGVLKLASQKRRRNCGDQEGDLPPADRGEFIVDKYEGTSLLFPFYLSALCFVNLARLGYFMLASTAYHVVTPAALR